LNSSRRQYLAFNMVINQDPNTLFTPHLRDEAKVPSNGITQVHGHEGASLNGTKVAYTNGKATPSQYAIPLNQQLAFTPRKIRVITIGAGYSGLIIAHKFQHRYPEMQDMVEHTIFEGRSEVGGTWLVNTYPGVQCDVPAHIYVRLICCLATKNANALVPGIPV
jgi:hypothetical protein